MFTEAAALFSAQNRRLFKFHRFADAEQELLLENFNGSEGLSQIYHYDIQLLCQDAGIELKSLIGQLVAIEIELADGSTRYINGYINRFTSLGSDGGIARYSASLVPWLWMCSCRFDSQIFQDMTVQDVVSAVFGRFGALPNFEFRLTQPLKTYSYITQYRESDMHFVMRLLEAEGLFFYFTHYDVGHQLIITDDFSTLAPIPETPNIRFHSASVTETADSITQWSANRQLQPNRVATQTFDYRQPQNRLPVSMDSRNNQGQVAALEIYDFPGQYTHGDYTQGETLVRNRLEALELLGKGFAGASNCRAMRAGCTFELTQHYDHDQGSAEDRQFLLIGIDHSGSNNYSNNAQAYYSNRFTCVRKKIPFRPQLGTRKPLISGPQTAIVAGPPGEEIYTDELGRVKVQFHWDRYGEHNDKSSCWVRVAQSGASGGFGAILLPRVGDEVVVSFMDGDPDRPFVTGSLYNSMNTPPWSLPANKTQSGFLTRSIKGRNDKANFFRFEDKAGQEQVSVHAERNMDTEIEADEFHTVGRNRTIKVSGQHAEKIKLDSSIVVEDGNYFVTVDKGEVRVKAATSITLEVGSSKLVINADGTIKLEGTSVDIVGHSIINLNK
jgi:type VI secretion system secreted protein VgrG